MRAILLSCKIGGNMYIKKWLTKDMLSGVGFLLFSVWWQWGASFIVVRKFDTGLSAAYMPKLLGYLLTVLAACLIGQAVKEVLDGKTEEADKVNTNHLVTFGLLACLTAYCLLFKAVGFIICTVLFLFTTMSWLCDPKEGKKKDMVYFLKMLGISVVITALLYIIFCIGFKISFPGGILNF